MPRRGAHCRGEESKAWAPTTGGGALCPPRAAPSVAGEVLGRHL